MEPISLRGLRREGDDQSVIDLTRALLAEENPSNRESGVARVVAARMRELGYDEVYTDEMGNVAGLVKGTGSGGTDSAAAGASSILFDAHMDTIGVTPRAAWRHDPFGGEIEGNRMYGRGTSDMKGAIAGLVEGIGWLARARQGESRAMRPAGDIWIVASVAEEMMEGVALTHVLENIPSRTGRAIPQNIVVQVLHERFGGGWSGRLLADRVRPRL